MGWITDCGFDHRLKADPIVFPRHPGKSRLNDFFGNHSTNAFSTYKSLRRANHTSCKLKADKAAYWAPALKYHGAFVKPIEAAFYYRSITTPHSAVHAFPPGLKIIAGDSHATQPQSTNIVYWSCDGGQALNHPIDCGSGNVTAHVNFPDCWDGKHLDSANHKSHMAYSHENAAGNNVCPADHPVPVPRLIERLEWNVHDGTEVSLSSGPAYTLHADFINAWLQKALVKLVHDCINAGKECGKPTTIP